VEVDVALQGNGQLLIKVRAQPFAALFSAASPMTVPGYALEPLSRAPQASPHFAVTAPADHWLVARSVTMAPPDPNPWNAAHAAASVNGYAHYVEPDILHQRPGTPPSPAENGLNDAWAPTADDRASPGWHLGPGFAGFSEVRAIATGTGIRIAHLDTGYSPQHRSKPRHLRPDLGYDYWDNKPDAVDPGGPRIPGLMPGHGTATLALLAGNTLDLTFAGQPFQGDFGGAPDAEVIPVRIGPSVVHIYSSTMAKGLYHAMAPAQDVANRCDVVSISHGGLPCASWADAVNAAYEAGITIVAASGDSFYFAAVDLATRYTVYPSAFNRVTTAVGATYLKLPYITDKIGAMQGCWGPDAVMEKAVAGYTPNVAWMDFESTDGFDMNGCGTSASTPQVAAACALWLQLYGSGLPADWRRVEACRLALFKSVDNLHPNKPELGRGTLNVARMLDGNLAAAVIADITAGRVQPSAADSVSFPFWRLLVGAAPPDSQEEQMYEAEIAQVVLDSGDSELLSAARRATAPGASFSPVEQARLRVVLAARTISDPLRNRINRAPPAGAGGP
jgi:Subtilase family